MVCFTASENRIFWSTPEPNNSFENLAMKRIHPNTLTAYSSIEFLTVELRFEEQRGVKQARGEKDHSRWRKQHVLRPCGGQLHNVSYKRKESWWGWSRVRGQREYRA